MPCGGFKPLQFILQAQFSTFEVSDLCVVRRRGSKNTFELFLQSTVFLFERCNMSLNGHAARPSIFKPTSSSPSLEFQVCDDNVTWINRIVEGEMKAISGQFGRNG
ncbi:hypothetical protein Agau_L100353 [Agrobacterium tumefaciens F2]|nr:hypothetical protein Agau_L100353 [Agrobacterium tumefaciens F2]CUX59485.1 conserved hypothetical protein [Agrobacterium genomosp. 5 str. CFBP 6626]